MQDDVFLEQRITSIQKQIQGTIEVQDLLIEKLNHFKKEKISAVDPLGQFSIKKRIIEIEAELKEERVSFEHLKDEMQSLKDEIDVLKNSKSDLVKSEQMNKFSDLERKFSKVKINHSKIHETTLCNFNSLAKSALIAIIFCIIANGILFFKKIELDIWQLLSIIILIIIISFYNCIIKSIKS